MSIGSEFFEVLHNTPIWDQFAIAGAHVLAAQMASNQIGGYRTPLDAARWAAEYADAMCAEHVKRFGGDSSP